MNKITPIMLFAYKNQEKYLATRLFKGLVLYFLYLTDRHLGKRVYYKTF